MANVGDDRCQSDFCQNSCDFCQTSYDICHPRLDFPGFPLGYNSISIDFVQEINENHDFRYKTRMFVENFYFLEAEWEFDLDLKKNPSEFHVLSRCTLHFAQFLNWCVVPELFLGD